MCVSVDMHIEKRILGPLCG